MCAMIQFREQVSSLLITLVLSFFVSYYAILILLFNINMQTLIKHNVRRFEEYC